MVNASGWSLLHAKVHRMLRQRQLLPRHQRVLVAVSGGQDSLCLMRLLLDLQPKWGWHVAIAHCNHNWRSDATANADYVEALAKTWQVPYYQATAVDLEPSEAEARHWRYQVLTEFAQTHNYAIVVTGHTASDRAETLLYNLIRGSGADGLQALAWQRQLAPNVQLVRPLLDITRAETAQFCQASQLTVWEDATNQDWHYARNRIRQDLLPYLQKHFNPQAEQALAQTTELLQAEVEYLDSVVDTLWSDAVMFTTTEQWQVNRHALKTAPLAIQRRLMRRLLYKILPIAPNFEHVEKLTALINAPNRSQTDPFPGGTIARVEGQWIKALDT